MRAVFSRWLVALSVSLWACATGVHAQAQEDSIKRSVESRFGVKVEGVRKAPFLGLYEIVVAGDDREIAYTDEAASYLFSGNVYELKSRRNLTQERLDRLNAIRFEDLPLDLAIKQVRGNGKRVVAVFSDPFCPYCRQLDQSLAKLDDITVYTFLYPILRKDESPEMSTRIWCAPDKAKAYLDLMLRNRTPPRTSGCSAPVDKWLALGEKLKVRATPVSFTTSGVRVVGARAEELQRAIEDSVRR